MKPMIKRIHSFAPIRICDIGGWTDTWFAGHGAVFHIAVSPCVEIQASVYPGDPAERVLLNLENYGETYRLTPGESNYGNHPMIEAAIDMVGIPDHVSVRIDIFSNAPAGASVGSSASLCVALIGALDALTPGRLTPADAATMAHRVETERLGLESGIQDQLAAAYGGINYVYMDKYPHAEVTPLLVAPDISWALESRLSLVYIGSPHNSSDIHRKVIADLGEKAPNDARIEGLRRLANRARELVIEGNFKDFGEVMNRATDLQRELHPHLVCKKFEEVMTLARDFGAMGCKVNGAGGDGGSITILGDGDASRKRDMLREMATRGYRPIPVSLSPRGLTVYEEWFSPMDLSRE